MNNLYGLPWSATKTPAGKGKVIDCKGFSVCSFSGGPYDEQFRHAEAIAKAVNSHYAIIGKLATLKDLVKLKFGNSDDAVNNLIDEAEVIIKDAEL